MKLIALSGKAKSGKNTVATILRLADSWKNSDYFKIRYPDKKYFIKHCIELHSDVGTQCSTYSEVAFASVLKFCVALIFGIEDPNDLNDQLFKESENSLGLTDKEGNKYTYRQILQLLGTEVGRAIHPDLWVNSLFAHLDKDDNYIITDVRYVNEAEACKEAEGIVVRINRDVPEMEHSSETELDNYEFDHVIDNNGSLEELINKVLQLNLV